MKNARTVLVIPEDDYLKLLQLSVETGVPFNEFVRRAIKGYAAQYGLTLDMRVRQNLRLADEK